MTLFFNQMNPNQPECLILRGTCLVGLQVRTTYGERSISTFNGLSKAGRIRLYFPDQIFVL